MSYDIPPGHGLVVVGLNNSAFPAMDTIRFGLKYINLNTLVAADFQRIANVFRDNIKTAYDNAWEIGPVRQYYTVISDLELFEDSTLEQGTNAASVYAAPNCAYVVKKTTRTLGRKGRGRVYLPGVDETGVDEAGQISSAFRTFINTQMSNLLTAVNADAAVDYMALLHQSPTTLPPLEIVSLTCQQTVGTMRKRVRRA